MYTFCVSRVHILSKLCTHFESVVYTFSVSCVCIYFESAVYTFCVSRVHILRLTHNVLSQPCTHNVYTADSKCVHTRLTQNVYTADSKFVHTRFTQNVCRADSKCVRG